MVMVSFLVKYDEYAASLILYNFCYTKEIAPTYIGIIELQHLVMVEIAAFY